MLKFLQKLDFKLICYAKPLIKDIFCSICKKTVSLKSTGIVNIYANLVGFSNL